MSKDDAIQTGASNSSAVNESQLADAVILLGPRVTEKGGAFFYNDASSHDVPLDNLTAFKATLTKRKAAPVATRIRVQALRIEHSLMVSLAARGELLKQVGELEANRIAKHTA